MIPAANMTRKRTTITLDNSIIKWTLYLLCLFTVPVSLLYGEDGMDFGESQ